MSTVKFEAIVENGAIKLPHEYRYLESRRLEILASVIDETVAPKGSTLYTEEYLEENWREMVSKALANVDVDNDEWKIEYGTYLMEKLP